MRLLDVRTYKLHTFYGDNIPPYAILSHTWLADEEEVTFAEVQVFAEASAAQMTYLMTQGRGIDFENFCKSTEKPGFDKIEYLCEQAIKDGFEFAWIDTCCIDKTNSTELSEAINSMFDWYSNSSICYAYLVDIDHAAGANFLLSRWWSRAWTLQELVASNKVEFYDMKWRHIGSKNEQVADISRCTGIDEETLKEPRKMFFKSVAQRMSWAARRKATRLEDRAYSLLGIFEISMSMQYGEGVKAFMRLQEEILKTNNDQTLFAWEFVAKTISEIVQDKPRRQNFLKLEYSDTSQHLYHKDVLRISQAGLFANSSSRFRNCGQIIFHHRYALETHIAKQNGAWRMDMPLIKLKTKQALYHIGVLPCGYIGGEHHLLAILLRAWTAGNRFERTSTGYHGFTFLVDSEAISNAYTEKLWVDNMWWIARYKDPATGQCVLNRSINVCFSKRESTYKFMSALPEDAHWIEEDSVLQLHDRADHSMDNVLLSFKDETGSQIHFVLQLPTSYNTISHHKGEVLMDKIIAFAGPQGEPDWETQFQGVRRKLSEASQDTDILNIRAEVESRRVFNQLISTLLIYGRDDLITSGEGK